MTPEEAIEIVEDLTDIVITYKCPDRESEDIIIDEKEKVIDLLRTAGTVVEEV